MGKKRSSFFCSLGFVESHLFLSLLCSFAICRSFVFFFSRTDRFPLFPETPVFSPANTKRDRKVGQLPHANVGQKHIREHARDAAQAVAKRARNHGAQPTHLCKPRVCAPQRRRFATKHTRQHTTMHTLLIGHFSVSHSHTGAVHRLGPVRPRSCTRTGLFSFSTHKGSLQYTLRHGTASRVHGH